MKLSQKIPSNKIKGFTLIEFLVASSLAIIVIMAAGSTYFFTRRLNDNAQTRVDRQNALRNAATMISRDARVAGTFGCFVTGGAVKETGDSAKTTKANSGEFPRFTAGGTHVSFNNENSAGYGVAVVTANNAQTMIGNIPAGVELTGDMLVFVYGKGNTGVGIEDPARADFANLAKVTVNMATIDPDVREGLGSNALVLSSCAHAYNANGSAQSGNAITFSAVNANGKFTKEKVGELSLSRMYAVGYVLANVNGVRSLLRFQTGADGTWMGADPQLLVSNISAMRYSFAYANSCDLEASAPAAGIQFAYSDQLEQQNLPALIQIQLDYEQGLPPYVINANIRGGNACANTGLAD